MNSAALKSACATSSTQPASAASEVSRTEEHHHEAELADGPVREHQLQVVLAQRPQTPRDDRDAAHREDGGRHSGAVAKTGARRATR